MRTHIRFDGEGTFELTEHAITAFGGYSSPTGWSLRASVGALVDGTLESDDTPGTHDIGPGLVAAIGAARQWTLGDGAWFVTGSAGLSIATATTHLAGATDSPRLTAGDARVGVIAGRTLATLVSPYLLARVFGGPVLWTIDGDDASGTDTRHFQLGAGASVAFSFGLTLVVDLSVLGEQATSLGASWRL